jgi:mannose-6-phosphate isomerase
MKPLALPPNLLHRFYRGGPGIAELRGIELAGDHMPEDWVGAVNAPFGSHGEGLSRFEDGTLVRDALAADPEAFLGPEHVARFGSDVGLLVKILDAGQRLPVHFHPGRAFARRVFDDPHGKTEAWIIVSATPGAAVHLGFAAPVDAGTVRGWIRDQDAPAMLAAMRELPVAAGDAILVPAGTPHAIGEGILLVELQEPTDYSVLMEWRDVGVTESEGHLGIGWDQALEDLDLGAWDDARVAAVSGQGAGRRLLPAEADPYFRAERVRGGDELAAGFSILVALAGSGTLAGRPLRRGETVLVPHAAGPCALGGAVEAIRCRPADPAAQDGAW